MFYVRNIDSGDVDELVVKGCGVPCVLQEFVEVLRPIVSFNFKEDCEDNFGWFLLVVKEKKNSLLVRKKKYIWVCECV